jgi:hypothetical protein
MVRIRPRGPRTAVESVDIVDDADHGLVLSNDGASPKVLLGAPSGDYLDSNSFRNRWDVE